MIQDQQLHTRARREMSRAIQKGTPLARLTSAVRHYLQRHPVVRAALLLLGGCSATALTLHLLLRVWRRSRSALRLRSRCVFITGAGMGLGAGLAHASAERGAAALLLCDINPAALAATKTSLLAAAAQRGAALAVHTFTCDVSSDAEVGAMAARIADDDAIPPIDVLINNAGIVVGRPLLSLSAADATRTLHVNCLSNFIVLRHLLPSLVERNAGYVVTIASLMGVVSAAQLSDYCASKAAQIAMHNSLRLEMRRAAPKLSLLLVNPWCIETGMFKGVATGASLRVRLGMLVAPMLRPRDVVRRTLDAVETGETLLVMPRVMRWLPNFVGLLPPELGDTLKDWMGGIDSMDTFVGREEKI